MLFIVCLEKRGVCFLCAEFHWAMEGDFKARVRGRIHDFEVRFGKFSDLGVLGLFELWFHC